MSSFQILCIDESVDIKQLTEDKKVCLCVFDLVGKIVSKGYLSMDTDSKKYILSLINGKRYLVKGYVEKDVKLSDSHTPTEAIVEIAEPDISLLSDENYCQETVHYDMSEVSKPIHEFDKLELEGYLSVEPINQNENRVSESI